jgi:hypothetical protein
MLSPGFGQMGLVINRRTRDLFGQVQPTVGFGFVGKNLFSFHLNQLDLGRGVSEGKQPPKSRAR